MAFQMQSSQNIRRVRRAVVVKKTPGPQRLCGKLLSISFFVLLCALLWPIDFGANAKEATAAAQAKPKSTGTERFEPEIAAFEKWDRQNAVPRDCILFVGSSSIRLWQTAEAFPDLPVINRGFGGSTVPDVIHFADRIVFKYRPRTIVFYAGDNDLAAGRKWGEVFSDIETFENRVLMASNFRRGSPTRLVYLPIKPSPARWKFWPEAQKVNERLYAIAEKVQWVKYVDTATPLLGPDGQPRKELFRNDGLHLNDQGYKIWNKLLAPYLTPSPSGRGPG